MIAGLVALVLAAADCAQCHKQQAEAFAGSRHSTAAIEPIFTVSYANAHSPWCLECHQPTRRAKGLTCQACHGSASDPRAVVGTHAPRKDTSKSHPVIVEPGLTVSACSRCHEFNAPYLSGSMNPMRLSNMPMQSTVMDMLAFDAGAQCTDCHDPHRPHGAHDPATLKSGVKITARATDGGTELEITAINTAHRFPTGDSFRRLVLSVCDDQACTHPIAEDYVGPHFVYAEGAFAAQFDRTLHSGETKIFQFPAARWWRARLFFGNRDFEVSLKPHDIYDDVGGGEFLPSP